MQTEVTSKDNLGFNVLMLKRLIVILKVLFPSLYALSFGLMSLLLLLSFLEQFLTYFVGLIPSNYYKVLGSKDWSGFVDTTWRSLGLVVSIAVLLGTKTYVASILSVTWRYSLCHYLHQLYFSGINYYSLNVFKTDLDNPDQRMTQDVSKFCSSLATIAVTVIISPFQIVYYTYKAYYRCCSHLLICFIVLHCSHIRQIYSNITKAVLYYLLSTVISFINQKILLFFTGWVGPSSIILFFIVSTIINKLIMSPIVQYVVYQEKCEGNFRFKHMQVRMYSESVAFCVSGPIESFKINYSLKFLIKAQEALYKREFWLNLVQNLFDYLGSIISYLAIAVPIFSGYYDDLDDSELASVISANSFVCMYLIYSFSKLVDLTGNVVDLSGVTHRIAELLEKLNDFQQEFKLCKVQAASSYTNLKDNPSGSSDTTEPSYDTENLLDLNGARTNASIITKDNQLIDVAFILSKITVVTPGTDYVLIKDLDLEICSKCNLLIMGPSSSGKSSLLRILRGLWSIKDGCVAYDIPPGPKTLLFLPQKPLMTSGSLLEQIMYPLLLDPNYIPEEWVCKELLELLTQLNMQGLVNRCCGLQNDPLWNWHDVLSPGELQRVCFLRLFYHRPQFALLDEATSALSHDIEEFLYSHCIKLNITLISVGHRESLKMFHSSLLTLDGNGMWKLESLNPSSDMTE